MACNKESLVEKKKLRSQNLSTATIRQPGRDIQKMLQLINTSNDLDLLHKIFSTLGLLILSKRFQNSAHEKIIKFEAVYRKLAFVLKSGLQTKAIIALNLISAILYLDDQGGITKNKTLHIYGKNMLRICGCLTAMNELFTNSMMHQDTWKALCRSIRDTCDGCITNQSHCSHLVPLCIQRCQRGCLDSISVLQSLLSNHHRNIKLFHETNGMTIFTRESLLHPGSIILLNTIVESTNSENQGEILNASHLFHELQYYLHKYGLESTIGQSIAIVLHSHRKVFGRSINEVRDKEKILNNKSFTITPYTTNNTENYNNTCNETNDLFRNVLNEVIVWQNQCGNKNNFKSIYENGNYRLGGEPQTSNARLHPTANKLLRNATEYETSNCFRSSFAYNSNHDLSFSFLLKHNEKKTQIPETKNLLGRDIQNIKNNDLRTENSFRNEVESSSKEKQEETISEFNPPFVSTPKSKKINSKDKTIFLTSKKSFRSSTRFRIIGDRSINGRSKLINAKPAYKQLRNRSMSAKIFDIVNESCTTLIKGIKNIFTSKEAINTETVTTYVKEDKSSFTNNMKQNGARREARVAEYADETNFSKEFSMEFSNFGSCHTCNDTIVLRDKLRKDATLQQTLKKLKLGINLYGCDFKKISRTMWPQESYMTPNVIYNLYRKLILKQ